MSATITKFFKINNALSTLESLETDNYYFFAGKSTPWEDDEYPDGVTDKLIDVVAVKNNIVFLKKIPTESSMLCVPMKRWTSGTFYKKYKSSRTSRECKQMSLDGDSIYCMSSSNQVYICLDTPNDSEIPSTDEPSGIGLTRFQTPDGYTWKFILDLDLAVSTKFLKSEWFPVPNKEDDKTVNQINIEDNSISGTVDSLTILNGGSGYALSTTISIVGDGVGAEATLQITNGEITGAEVTQVGSGYTIAQGVINGSGIDGSIDIEISPINGHGYEAYKDLGAHYIMCVGYFNNSETNLFPEMNSFRQIGIIFEPTNNTNVPLTGTAYSNLTKVSIDNIVSGIPFDIGELAIGQTSGAYGTVFSAPSDGELLGELSLINTYGTFLLSETIVGETASAQYQSIVHPDMKKYSGDIVYLENIKPVTRHIAQAEKFSFVVEF